MSKTANPQLSQLYCVLEDVDLEASARDALASLGNLHGSGGSAFSGEDVRTS